MSLSAVPSGLCIHIRQSTEACITTITCYMYICTYTGLENCTITSPSANTIRVSCESLGRISVTISSNSCTCSQPIAMVDDNPITVSDLAIGVYTVEVTAVNSNDMSIENNKIVGMITVSDKSTGGYS